MESKAAAMSVPPDANRALRGSGAGGWVEGVG